MTDPVPPGWTPEALARYRAERDEAGLTRIEASAAAANGDLSAVASLRRRHPWLGAGEPAVDDSFDYLRGTR